MFGAMLVKHIPHSGHLRYSDHNKTSTIRTGQSLKYSKQIVLALLYITNRFLLDRWII